jgi:hypothetical protein
MDAFLYSGFESATNQAYCYGKEIFSYHGLNYKLPNKKLTLFVFILDLLD